MAFSLTNPSRLSSLLAQMRAGVYSRNDAILLKGWEIFATDTATGIQTFLGFIPGTAMPKELVDIPLADGVYEIEARPTEWYWQGTRSRKAATLITDPQGGGAPITGLPVIQNLRVDVVNFRSRIQWDVLQEMSPGAFKFGLWFGPAPGVDTSGPPDATIRFQPGQGAYQFIHTQVAQEYVAVAAFIPTQQGEVAEILLPWDTVAPDSPEAQHVDTAGFEVGAPVDVNVPGDALVPNDPVPGDIDGGFADTVYVNPDLDGGFSDSIFDPSGVDGGGA